MPSKYFDKVAHKVTPDINAFVTNSLDIIDQVHYLLEKKGMTQKELAQRMGKSESEISKILSAGYSMTLLTISKVEAALEGDIIVTPLRYAKKLEGKPAGAENQGAKVVSFKHDSLYVPENSSPESSPYDSEASVSKRLKKTRLYVA